MIYMVFPLSLKEEYSSYFLKYVSERVLGRSYNYYGLLHKVSQLTLGARIFTGLMFQF